jgi:hypothetical protein
MAPLVGFVGPSYSLQSFSVDCQRTVNLFPQIDESGVGKNIASLFSTPGLKLFADLGVSPIRALMTTSKGRVFSVSSENLYEITADGTSTACGTLLTSSGLVSIADNGIQLMIVDGPNGYQYDLNANVLTQLAGFPGGSTIAFQDGYFIFNQPGTQTFFISGLYATTVDALDFASKEGNPDLLVSLLSDHRNLWLFGSETTEVWFDSGAELFPFSRIDGAFITHGTIAPASPCALDNTIYWLGQDSTGNGMVWMANGYQPVRASTHAMEQAIAAYPRIDDATSFAYQLQGHAFYVLNFPSGNATWVYDAATQLWHERAYTPTGPSIGLQRHRAETHTVGFGLHLVGDYENGNIYILDPNTFNDNGNPITRIRTAPYVNNELKNLFISKLQLDMHMGLGKDGDAIIPQAMLQWSDDGGATWSNENWISLGAIGNTLARAIWRRLGRTRQRVFRVTVTDDVFLAIVNAYIDVQAGTS